MFRKSRFNLVGLSILVIVSTLLSMTVFQSVGLAPVTGAAIASGPITADPGSGRVAAVGAPTNVVLSDLPQAPAASANPSAVPLRVGVSASDYAARKQQALTRGLAPLPGEVGMSAPALNGGVTPLAGPVAIGPDVVSPNTPTVRYNFAGIPGTGWSPSDMALAVGPTYVLQVVNESIAIYSKTGVLQAGYPKTLQAFSGCGCSNSLFDPRAYYDWYSGRYVVEFARDNGSSASSSFYIAASSTGDPRGAWHIYQLTYGGTNDFGDFPTLGFDRQGIYTCFSTFSNSTGGFVSNKCFLIPSAKVYAGAAFSYWFQFGFSAGGVAVDSIQPVKTKDTDQPRVEYMVNSFNILSGGGQCATGCSGVVVWAISNPFGFTAGGPSPVFSGVVVPTASYILPPGANAPGCANCVDTNDTRISGQPVYHAGSIWAAIDTGVGTSPAHPGIRWWEIGTVLDDNGGACTGAYVNYCPKITSGYLKQQGLYYYSDTTSGAWFPVIQPDGENNVVMVFAYSTSSTLPSVVYATRRINYTLNTFHDSGVYLVVGSGSVTHGIRWGDYFATSDDNSLRPNRLWIAGQVNSGTNNWATRIGEEDFYSRYWAP